MENSNTQDFCKNRRVVVVAEMLKAKGGYSLKKLSVGN